MKHGLNKNGRFRHSLAGLPRIPEDGYYEYRTNPDPRTDPWIITGAMKVNRVLSKAEVVEMVRAAGREPQKVQGEEGVGFSVITQKHLVDSLKAKPELQGFMDCVQRVEQMKERNSLDRKEYFFGALPAKVINEVQKELPANIDLAGARLSLNAQDVWYMYRGHCLDSFMYDDQVSITFDDIRMIPDIINSYDSVKAEKESGKWKLVFLKKYGDITYKYISEISRKHDWPKVRHATLKTGWLIKSTGAEGDFTSRQSQTQTVSHFPRTAIVTPLEVHIKQNYKDEARMKVAKLNATRH